MSLQIDKIKCGVRALVLTACGCVGMLTVAAQAQDTQKTHTYDALGRLIKTEVQRPQQDTEVREIEYDKAGNRTRFAASKTGSSGSNGNGQTNDPPLYAVVPLNGMSLIRIR